MSSPPRHSPSRPLYPLAALLLLCACPHGTDRTPLQTAQRYLDAAVAGDIDRSYALLAGPVQRTCDRTCLRRILDAQHTDLRAARDVLRTPATDAVSIARTPQQTLQATVEFSDGSTLRLAQLEPAPITATRGTAGRAALPLLLTENPLQFYPQDTPQQALASFLLAVQRRRYDVLVRFLPQSLTDTSKGSAPYDAEQIRQRFEGAAASDLARQISAVQRHLREPLQLSPDGVEARLPVGEGRAARLLQEQGSWRVAQLE